MRTIIVFEEKDVVTDGLEEDEIEHAKKYIGNYTLKTMSFGQRNEAQYQAIEVNPAMPEMSKIDPWKFRFYSLLWSLEELPVIGKRTKGEWPAQRFKALEKFIYESPAIVGEKLLVISDQVNTIKEEDEKNL